MASTGPANPDTVAIKVKTLIASQLKQVLKKEGLPVSGVKAALQTRIIEQLHTYARNNNLEQFNHLRNLVYNPEANPADHSPSPSTNGAYGNNSLPPPPNHYSQPFGSSSLRPECKG
ncbi:hypothetical protein P7C71_g4703, partial [Lecanoromycetidae sp. Uapishka_2]